MKRFYSIVIASGIVLIGIELSAYASKGSPSAKPSVVASPAPLVSPSPSLPKVLPSLTPLQSKQLSKEFAQALRTELRALEHRHKFELTELRASQAARLKEWQRNANEERRKFFTEHPRGPDRRAYVQDLMARRKAFKTMMKDEEKRRLQEQTVRYQALKNDQLARQKEFDQAIKNKEVPPNRLWPQPGH